MIQSLQVLNSTGFGRRDLYWVDDPAKEVVGYNVYRAFDSPDNWIKLTRNGPVPGHSYRDQTRLKEITYTVQDEDWTERGEQGRWIFQVPEGMFYTLLRGRPICAMDSSDITLIVDGNEVSAARVDGQEGVVWLPQVITLSRDGSRDERQQVKPPSEVIITYRIIEDSVGIYLDGTRTFYTVVPVLASGQEQHPVGAKGTPYVDTLQVDAMDYMQAEMVRRNAWIFEMSGEPAFLLFRRTKGEWCSCQNTGLNQARTGCPSCYETGIVGGYYGPVDIYFIDPDTGTSFEVEEGGRKVTRQSRSFLGPSPIVQSGDLICRRNGERLVVSNVTYKSPRGVLLQQEFDVELLNINDTRYKIPLYTDEATVPFAPAFTPVNDGITHPANEPVTNPLTDPTKLWENKDKVPQGRTVVFGNIQS
jgi:hypothetical protein